MFVLLHGMRSSNCMNDSYGMKLFLAVFYAIFFLLYKNSVVVIIRIHLRALINFVNMKDFFVSFTMHKRVKHTKFFFNRDLSAMPPGSEAIVPVRDKVKMDSEYLSLIEELGESTPKPVGAEINTSNIKVRTCPEKLAYD